MKIITDERCTAGNYYLLNERHLDLYELPVHPDFVDGSIENFGWTGWKKPTNQQRLRLETVDGKEIYFTPGHTWVEVTTNAMPVRHGVTL